MRRQLKAFAKSMMSAGHRAALKAGVVVLPNHYYTPIADTHELGRTQAYWARRSPMVGVDVDVESQAANLRTLVKPFEPEFRGNKTYLDGVSRGFGPGFGYIEAQCFHAVLRSLKPLRLIEVGSGVSTYCAMEAAALNQRDGRPMSITCIEPNPRAFLKSADARGVALRDFRFTCRPRVFSGIG